MRADLCVVILILLVPDGLVGKDDEGAHPGHSLPGGHDHLEGESHFIIALSWQPQGVVHIQIHTEFPFGAFNLCHFELSCGSKNKRTKVDPIEPWWNKLDRNELKRIKVD